MGDVGLLAVCAAGIIAGVTGAADFAFAAAGTLADRG